LVHTLTHPGRNTRQFVIIAAGLAAAALVAFVLVFTLSHQGGRRAEVQPPRVETGSITRGERTVADQRHWDRLEQLNTTADERTGGGRTVADQRHWDRLEQLNTTADERTGGGRTVDDQRHWDRLQQLNTTP
jgi:hypothetical protein